jgi:predicted nucleic acid-binding protein
VDAGPVVAVFDTTDPHHGRCRELLLSHPGPLWVPALAVTEVAYFLGRRGGIEPELHLLRNLHSGTFLVEPVHPADWIRIAELVARYRDLPLGTVDASVVAAAERLGVTELATLDHRHFGVVRPAHVDAFTLLP